MLCVNIGEKDEDGEVLLEIANPFFKSIMGDHGLARHTKSRTHQRLFCLYIKENVLSRNFMATTLKETLNKDFQIFHFQRTQSLGWFLLVIFYTSATVVVIILNLKSFLCHAMHFELQMCNVNNVMTI